MKTKERIDRITCAASTPAWDEIERSFNATATSEYEGRSGGLAGFSPMELRAVLDLSEPAQAAAIEVHLIECELADAMAPVREHQAKLDQERHRRDHAARELAAVKKKRAAMMEREPSAKEIEISDLQDQIRWSEQAIAGCPHREERPQDIERALTRLKEIRGYSGPLDEGGWREHVAGLAEKVAKLRAELDGIEPLDSTERRELNRLGSEMRRLESQEAQHAERIDQLTKARPCPDDQIGSALVRAWAAIVTRGLEPLPAEALAAG